jgi:hypothetical protein
MDNQVISPDSVKLLEECNKGIKMGISSINQVMEYVSNNDLCALLNDFKEEHLRIERDIMKKIKDFDDEIKDPNPLTEAMSMIMTNAKMMAKDRDAKIAELMHDGCNMGIKSICKYINKYPDACRECIKLGADIIKLEDDFMQRLRKFL